MSFTRARASRMASSSPKDFDFQFFVFQDEGSYMMFYGGRRLLNWLNELPEKGGWNALLAILWMLSTAIGNTVWQPEPVIFGFSYADMIEIAFNICYGIHLVAMIYYDTLKIVHNETEFKWIRICGYVVDGCTYYHYLVHDPYIGFLTKLLCYYCRVHRPFKYLYDLMQYNLKGTVLATLLKYLFFFTMLRIFYGFILSRIEFIKFKPFLNAPNWLEKRPATLFYRSCYAAHKCFLGLGVDFEVKTTMERIIIVVVGTSGTVTVLGVTITWVALIMSVYMRGGEVFRMRFRLIMKELEETHVPQAVRDKVVKYYRMYWHKQKAVSSSKLLTKFPPSLTNAVTVDIYFEALQKSRILSDLSYQFMSEIAKVMYTINYVPGDIIVKRSTRKSTMYFIKYGDIEVLTAEDDETPILRFTRGTIINPCGGCIEVAGAKAHVAVRAATFCTAHVLNTKDLWHVAAKFGRLNSQSFIIHSAFEEHFEKVKKHYSTRSKINVPYKSSILLLKRNLIDLKLAKDMNGKLLIGRDDKFIDIAGCYIMRNRADTTLNDESDAICLRSTFPCILQPTSSLQIAWATTVSVLNVIVVVVYPYRMLYYKTIPQSLRFFDFLVTIVYVFDIVAHLSTGDNIEEGVPVTFTQTSSEQTSNVWFVLDVLATLPVLFFINDGHFSGLNKLIKAPKIFRLLKTLDDLWLQQSYIMRSFIYIFFMVLTTYLMATVVQAFNCFGIGRCKVDNFTNEVFWTEAPLSDNQDDVDDLFRFSLFWVILLLTFTNIRTSGKAQDKWRVQLMEMCLLELGTVTRIMIDATFSSTIMVTETLRDAFATFIHTVSEFLAKNNVAPTLQHRFRCYFNIEWHIEKAFYLTCGKNVMFDLPAHVRSEILCLQRLKYLKSLPIMKYASKDEMKKISARANLFYSSPNEILLNTGDMSNEIYIMRKGSCDMIDPDTQQVVRVLSSKQYFGELECFLKIPAYYTVKASTHVQVFALSRRDIERVLSLPKIDATIKSIRQEALFRQLSRKRASFLKYEMPEPPTSVERFPLLRKHEPDTAFLAPFQRLGFFSILRYVFPRFTIRPDGKYLQRYEFLRMCCALLSAMVFPVYTWLVLEWPILYYLAFFLDCTAYFDVLQRMLIAYFNDKGILVYHPASTAANYVKGAFLVDLIACLPLESLDSMRDNIYIVPEYNTYRQTYSSQILRYNRMIQLYRVSNAIEMFKDYIGRDDVLLIIKGIPTLMSLMAVLSSLIMLLSAEIHRPIDIKSGHGWVIIPKKDDILGDWLADYNNCVRYKITSSPWTVFLTTYYWVVNETTTTGYSLFLATGRSILTFLMMSMFLGNLLTTFFAVRIISIRANVNQSLASFQQHMKDLVTYMKRENIDKELQKEAIAYYNYSWDKTGGTDYRKLLKQCAQISLRTDAIVHIYGTTFSRCPLLRRCDVSLLRVLGRGVYSTYYPEGMTVIEMNDIIGTLYFIDFGSMEVFDEYDDFVTKLPRGSVFGHFDNSKEGLITNKIVATANVHLLKIRTDKFYRIIEDFPNIQILINKHRPNRENYIIGSVGTSSKVVLTWKERAFSSALIMVTKQGSMKYLNIQSKTFEIYLITISLFCSYADLYNAAFAINSTAMISILYVCDFAFVTKLLFNYIVPYFTEEDTESRQVMMLNRKKYLAEEFKFDLTSCMPLEAFAFLDSTDRWGTFALLRLNRILRLITVQKCLKRYYEKLNINLTLTTVTMVLIWFSIFTHASACIWYKIAVIEDSDSEKTSWRYDSDGNKICENEYFCALYFVLTTFMQNGIGDIMARQLLEVAFTTALMILSTMIYMIYVGEFSNVIQFQAFRLFEYYTSKLECEEYLRNNRVAPTLITLVQKYILYLWREQRGKQMPQFLLNAPHCLRLQILTNAYMCHLHSHELFKHCEPAFLRILVGYFRLYTYMEGMYVVKEGEVTDCIYFIHKGSVKEVSEDFEEELRDFETGHHFGTANGLTHGQAFTYSYRTITKAQVLSLNLSHWKHLLDYFSDSRDAIFKKPDKDYDVCKVKEKKKTIPVRPPRVLFEHVDVPPDLPFLGIPSGRSDSDADLVSFKKKDTLVPITSEESSKVNLMKTIDNQPEPELSVQPSWPMFSRFSVAPGQRESSMNQFKKEEKDTEKEQRESQSKEKADLKSTGETKRTEPDQDHKIKQKKIDFSQKETEPEQIDKNAVQKEKTARDITMLSSIDDVDMTRFQYDDESVKYLRSKSDHEPKETFLILRKKEPEARVPSDTSLQSGQSNVSSDYEATSHTTRRSVVKALKGTLSRVKKSDLQLEDQYDNEANVSYKVETEPQSSHTLEKKKTVTTAKSGRSGSKLDFKDKVITIDEPQTDVVTASDDYAGTSTRRESQFSSASTDYSFAQDSDFKEVEDFMAHMTSDEFNRNELESESRASLQSTQSAISLSGKTSSIWSVERFLSGGNSSKRDKEKRKNQRVSVSSIDEPVSSTGSIETIERASVPSHQVSPDTINLDILDVRMLDDLPSPASSHDKTKK